MSRNTIAAALALAFGMTGMTGMTANASCVNPTMPGTSVSVQQMPKSFNLKAETRHHAGHILERIVGTWHVTYTGALAGQALIQWHSDGTEWENIDYPILGGTVCMGDWRIVDDNHVTRSHMGWLFDNGIPAGYFTETETNEVAVNGGSYHGTNHAKFFDLSGHMFAEADGTSEASRIAAP